jgi:hypothetical protein
VQTISYAFGVNGQEWDHREDKQTNLRRARLVRQRSEPGAELRLNELTIALMRKNVLSDLEGKALLQKLLR